jgi:hypothetical protein
LENLVTTVGALASPASIDYADTFTYDLDSNRLYESFE